ncbi:MAG: hypothetical protein HY725_21160 [Candidatus Rokubacteria bacterium]|nr:hypothetical protein [Candidatus Rokubacteria bacterium]
MAGYVTVVLKDQSDKEVVGGEIRVDGVDQGRTTDTIELSAGDHTVQVLAPIVPSSQPVTVTECEPKDAPVLTFRMA